MILNKAEILEIVKKYAGERTDDEYIADLENICETLDSYADREVSALLEKLDNLKNENERINMEWREKYIARFYTADEEEVEEDRAREEDMSNQAGDNPEEIDEEAIIDRLINKE